MKTQIMGCLLALACAGCSKRPADLPAPVSTTETATQTAVTNISSVLHTIKKGAHNSDRSTLQAVETSHLHFAVRFDSSAVYTSATPVNQFDINKLYGFSDNNMQHHQFSARFGWRWSEGALRLFAYIYNKGLRQEKELGTVAIGQWVECSIRVAGNQYLFELNGSITAMPRSSTTGKGAGYLLFPYFGGDEAAPHDVRIELRNL